MDYKELIGRYRLYATRWENGEQLLLNGEMRIQDTLRDAADAIETLLEERDSAVEELRGNCSACVHANISAESSPCYDCTWSAFCMSGSDNWEWRGRQKD